MGVLSEGAAIVVIGIVAGVAGGYASRAWRRAISRMCACRALVPLAAAAVVLDRRRDRRLADARRARIARRCAAGAQIGMTRIERLQQSGLP